MRAAGREYREMKDLGSSITHYNRLSFIHISDKLSHQLNEGGVRLEIELIYFILISVQLAYRNTCRNVPILGQSVVYIIYKSTIVYLIWLAATEERAAAGISLGGQESSFVTRPWLGAQMVLTIGENIMDQLCEICHCLPNTAVNNSENFLLNLLPPHRMLHQVRCQSLRLMIKDSSKCAEPNRKLTREIFQESSKLFYDIDNGGCKLQELVHRLNIRVSAERRSLTVLWRTNCLQFTAGIMGETRLGTWDQAEFWLELSTILTKLHSAQCPTRAFS